MTLEIDSKRRTRNAETKRRLRALRARPTTGEQCEVPGCEGDKIEGLDCCYEHSLYDAHNTSLTSIPNDGIIDTVAIDLAVQGARPVRLTRVEKNIALARLIRSGMSRTDAADRLGVAHSSMAHGDRAREIARITEVLANAA